MKVVTPATTWIGLIVPLMAASAGFVLADGPKPPPTASAPVPAPAMPPDLAGRVQDVTDAVLEHHIDPPARQQMLLSGLKAMYRAAGMPAPIGLGRRVSAIAAPGQLAAMLRETWSEATARPIDAAKLEDALIEGLLAPVPGRPYLMSAKESKVAEQMAGNRYVGIHVALSWDEKEERAIFHEVFPGGPADRAGVRTDDRLEEVDGHDTEGVKLRRVVDWLRGDEGTEVTIKVRAPKEAKPRTMKLTRGQLPRSTVTGVRKQATGGWTTRLDGPDPIGYLKIAEVSASTPHELRKLARQMEGQGLRALVLDLRGTQSRGGEVQVHPAVLLADSLLEGGPIGRVRTVRGETSYQADPDALFRGWPMAVLVDQGTSGVEEWIAAALQDNHRAVVVGQPTRGTVGIQSLSGRNAEAPSPLLDAFVTSVIPVGDGRWSIPLVTGYLERGDGRSLVARLDGLPGAGVQPDHRLPALVEPSPAGRKPGEMPGPVDRAYAAVPPDEAPRTSSGDAAVAAAVKVLHQYLPTRATEKP